MFRAIVLAHDGMAAQTIEQLALESREVQVLRSFESFPRGHELARLLNAQAPELIFMDLSDFTVAAGLAAEIRDYSPKSAIIGFGAGWAEEAQHRAGLMGVAELLVSPVNLHSFQYCVHRAIHKVHGGVQDNLIAFLPAKAGSGCTTVVMNTAGYLASELDKKVLVLESDLNSGVLSILLGAQPRHGILDALENSAQLDYSLWTGCVVSRVGVDFLMATRSRPLPAWSNYHHLLEYTKARYDFTLVDLPEVVNEATAEIFRRAKYIFVVCTPELPALTLAKRRCKDLEARGIPEDRIGIIVNRCQPVDAEASEAMIQEKLQHGVAAVFPNDYPTVQRATTASTVIEPQTDLGQTFAVFAKRLCGIFDADLPPQEKHKSRFPFLKSLSLKRLMM